MRPFTLRTILAVAPLLVALSFLSPDTVSAQKRPPSGGGSASDFVPKAEPLKENRSPMTREDRPVAIPQVFGKEVPESVEDLKSMQSWVKKISASVEKYTVAIRLSSSQGSGVIVTRDGYILTAAHVIREVKKSCTVMTADGKRHQATTIGLINGTDCGLIKLNKGTDWPFAKISQDSEIKHGMWCLAVGHPNGYISGRRPVVRLGRVASRTSRVLQSDCVLVGGDSGGPLFDMHGRVIGIHSRIGRQTDVNYHIPINQFVTTWGTLTKK